MSVIRTNRWLLNSYEKPIELCKKLKAQFEDGVRSSEIHNYLTVYGMYYHPIENGNELIKKLQKNNIWEIIKKEDQILQKKWNGPDIPIFIFPSDQNNRKIQQELNGKSGLAYRDKLFLFISEYNKEDEIRALFTHEYNHVCHLSKYNKKESEYVLLDTVILEGLAENAVREKFGEEFVSEWTTYYSNKELERLWNNLVLPNKNVPRLDHRHEDILYGLHSHPKLSGYCVGYYLVKKYMEENNLASNDLIGTSAETIAQIKKQN